MSGHMIDSDKRDLLDLAKCFCRGNTDQQRADESRSFCHTYTVDIIITYTGLLHSLGDNGYDRLNMHTRSDLGNDTAVLAVKIRLRCDHACTDDTAIFNYRTCRFITR